MPPQIYPYEPDKLEERGYKSFPNALEKDPLVFFHATAMDARDELPALQRNARRLHTALQEFWELQAKRDKLQMLEKSDSAIFNARSSGILPPNRGLRD